MLTWIWLARAKHELTKPKSTFCPQNFLLGLRASHEWSIPFVWAVVAQGQLSPWGSCLPGQLSPGQLAPGHLSPGQFLAHPRPDFTFHKIHVEWRVIISRIFFKIYHISTKYPATIHTAETIEILRQFKPKIENGRIYARQFSFEMLGFWHCHHVSASCMALAFISFLCLLTPLGMVTFTKSMVMGGAACSLD